MIFWELVTPLYLLSVYFRLFRLDKCLGDRVIYYWGYDSMFDFRVVLVIVGINFKHTKQNNGNRIRVVIKNQIKKYIYINNCLCTQIFSVKRYFKCSSSSLFFFVFSISTAIGSIIKLRNHPSENEWKCVFWIFASRSQYN